MPDSQNETLPTTVIDINRPWNRLGSDTALNHDDERASFKHSCRVWQEQVGHIIESRRAHFFILFLLTVDVACVIADLGYSFLSTHCNEGHEPDPTWLTVLVHVSLGITSIFLVEIILALFAFGPRYYNPFGNFPLAALHLFDAFVIITAFVLEVVLKGKEEELAALLIILRFWRIVKLVEGVAVGAGELTAEAAEELASTKEKLLHAQGELHASRNEIQRLRRRLLTGGIAQDDQDDEMQGRRNSSSSL
ncbi:Voltage-gated hydrogen channel 1 [Leucoagaricus sp. SymC.cos]|nr:Voltage-gated hydrogen channel 1 [Leucoagaricus sp. SymC.cos]